MCCWATWVEMSSRVAMALTHLSGGLGEDRLAGGADNDKFDFNSVKEAGKGSHRDNIVDFHRSEDDMIDLTGIDANTRHAGNQAFKFIGSHGFTHHAGELRASRHVLQGDVNGDGRADFEIHINICAPQGRGLFPLGGGANRGPNCGFASRPFLARSIPLKSLAIRPRIRP